MVDYFGLAGRIWWRVNLALIVVTAVLVYTMHTDDKLMVITATTIAGLVISLPVVVVLAVAGKIINRSYSLPSSRIRAYWLVTIVMAALGCVPYTLLFILFHQGDGVSVQAVLAPCLLMGITALTLHFLRDTMHLLFGSPFYHHNQTDMETVSHTIETPAHSSRILTKALVTGALILLMLIPTVFIINLVNERKERQKEVTREVSQKWSGAQTITGPFLYIPYAYTTVNEARKEVLVQSHVWILPDDLQVNGNLDHETRKRSIYNVLLYRARIRETGNFRITLPKDIKPEYVKWEEVKICLAVSDFKGIESRIVVKTGSQDIELSPGLPDHNLADQGLSAPAGITAADLDKVVPFSSDLQLRGSESMHFIPLGGNSSYALTSSWPAPSFDGNSLPSTREVNDSGFKAQWQFNKANLPFGTQLRNAALNVSELAFGVTMVQPADQYAKSERTVKYAILIIGLTFSLFFIVEVMQKKPVHPVQYILVGLALVIFYTLLLSISEFIVFDYAYTIAALATITLVSFYVRSHFGEWRAAGLFTLVLTLLYAFIFVLVRLEDTALLIGSIGLFIILAIAMYFSRKIDWYGHREASLQAA